MSTLQFLKFLRFLYVYFLLIKIYSLSICPKYLVFALKCLHTPNTSNPLKTLSKSNPKYAGTIKTPDPSTKACNRRQLKTDQNRALKHFNDRRFSFKNSNRNPIVFMLLKGAVNFSFWFISDLLFDGLCTNLAEFLSVFGVT